MESTMPDDVTATDLDPVSTEAPPANPFDSIQDDAPPDTGAPAATPVAEEPAPASSLSTDQPITTPEPKAPVNPLAAALEKPPVAPPQAPQALPPELEAIAKDPSRLKQLVNLEQLNGRQANELGQLR